MLRMKEGSTYKDLLNNKADLIAGYLSNEAFYFKELGVDINIINPANYGFDLYGDMLFTSTNEATNNPQRVQKFKQATIKGWQYALEHKEEIAQLIKNKYASNKSIEHLMYEANALEQIIQHRVIPIGTIDKGRVEFNLAIYEKHGLIKNSVPISDYIFESSATNEKYKVFLNEEENSYLKEKKVIKMCIDPDWMPLEKSDNGKHIGMSADYIAIMQEYIGIPIEMVDAKSWAESLQYGKERKCDIFSLVMSTKERESYLDFTKPYLKTPFVLVTNLEELFVSDFSKIADKKIGIVKDYAYAEIIKEKYTNIELVEVPNITVGLEMVLQGELYGFIDALATAGYQVQKNYLGQLKITGKFDDTWNLGIATRNDEPILKNIFDKAIDLIPSNKKDEILNRWTSVNYTKDINYTVLLQWLSGVVGVFSIILIAIVFVNRKLRAEINTRKVTEQRLQEYVELVEKISITDALTTLYNRRHFNEMFPKLINSAKREKQNICFAIMDIDYFKQYNDAYGHLAGDEALKNVAKTMKGCMLRGDDYCFRLGGEEFGILFKGSTIEEATKFIDTIKTSIENLNIEHKYNVASSHLTASFGLVVKDARSIQNSESLYKEADELLYKAKEQGRNKLVSNL